ncbi:MAG: ABC transporter permease [Promethearchaeota archaeon]
MVNRKITKQIFSKSMKGLIRDKPRFFFILLFPTMLTAIFIIAFSGDNESVYNIAVVNNDLDQSSDSWSNKFFENLSNSEILSVKIYESLNKANDDLTQGKNVAIIVIPENFSKSCDDLLSKPQSQWTNSTIELIIDQSQMFTKQILLPLLNEVLYSTLFGNTTSSPSLPVEIDLSSTSKNGENGFLDSLVSGMIIYAVFFNMMTFSQQIFGDKTKGLLDKYKLSKTTSVDLLIGETGGAFTASVIQTAIITLMAISLGFKPVGGITGLLSGMLVSLIFSLFPIGIGIIIGLKMKSEGATTAVSLSIIMTLSYFSGSFTPLEFMPDAIRQFAQFLPSTHANDALKSLIGRGASLFSGQILFDIGFVLLSGFIVYIIAWILFKREYN